MSKRSKEKKKMNKLEFGFTIFSLIFLIGFSCFYAYRLFYYKVSMAITAKEMTCLRIIKKRP